MLESDARKALSSMSIWLPSVGDHWTWEPDKPTVREEVVVTAVKWNGEEFWIETKLEGDGPHREQRHTNTWSRFMEACVLVRSADLAAIQEEREVQEAITSIAEVISNRTF